MYDLVISLSIFYIQFRADTKGGVILLDFQILWQFSKTKSIPVKSCRNVKTDIKYSLI